MLTRRSFLGTLAAVAAARVAPVPVAAAAVPSVGPQYFLAREGPFILTEDGAKSMSLMFERRDDGDTILERR